jgi:hypothetical protein
MRGKSLILFFLFFLFLPGCFGPEEKGMLSIEEKGGNSAFCGYQFSINSEVIPVNYTKYNKSVFKGVDGDLNCGELLKKLREKSRGDCLVWSGGGTPGNFKSYKLFGFFVNPEKEVEYYFPVELNASSKVQGTEDAPKFTIELVEEGEGYQVYSLSEEPSTRYGRVSGRVIKWEEHNSSFLISTTSVSGMTGDTTYISYSAFSGMDCYVHPP